MKKSVLRILSLCILAVLLSTAVIPVFAAEKPSLSILTMWAGNGSQYMPVLNFPSNAKIVSVKSSKPEVLQAVKEDDTHYMIQPLKAGKSKVTLKYKVGKKTSSISGVYTVKKNPKPLTSLKINGKSVDLRENEYGYELRNYKKSKCTITAKVRKGWKITSLYTPIDDQLGTFKLGKSFKVSKDMNSWSLIKLTNAKGELFDYMISINHY